MSIQRLTEGQIRRFETFGYLSLPGLLKDRAQEIDHAFESLWAERGGGHAGKRHDGKARSCLPAFLDQSIYLSSLLDDPRIEGIAASLLGDDFNYMGSDGNYYTGDTPWHSDGWSHSNPVRFIKIAFYLDALTRDTGALRVIPGTHLCGTPYAETIQRDIFKSRDTWGLAGPEIPAIALETQPGDVVVFNHALKHASFGGSKARRMFTMNCSQRFPEDKIKLLRDSVAGAARFWLDSAYGSAVVETANPRRMIHLEQILANQDHLPELVAKAKLEMLEPARG